MSSACRVASRVCRLACRVGRRVCRRAYRVGRRVGRVDLGCSAASSRRMTHALENGGFWMTFFHFVFADR